jgi:hypothetical protein
LVLACFLFVSYREIATVKFTTEYLAKIERDFEQARKNGKCEQIIFDDQLKGFGLRLQGNSRTWIVQYRATPTKQRRMKIGPWPAVSPRSRP